MSAGDTERQEASNVDKGTITKAQDTMTIRNKRWVWAGQTTLTADKGWTTTETGVATEKLRENKPKEERGNLVEGSTNICLSWDGSALTSGAGRGEGR